MNFKGRCRLGNGTKISNEGTLTFGNNFKVSASSTVLCKNNISFGDNCLVAWGCLFMDSDRHKIINQDAMKIGINERIKIEDHVWIGCNANILKGTYIQHDSIVGAGALVSKGFQEPNIIIGGTNQILKKHANWEY